MSLDPATSLTFDLSYSRKSFGTDTIIIQQSLPTTLQEVVSQPVLSAPPKTFTARVRSFFGKKITLYGNQDTTNELGSIGYTTSGHRPDVHFRVGAEAGELEHVWIYRPPGSGPSAEVAKPERTGWRKRDLATGYEGAWAAAAATLALDSRIRWEPVRPRTLRDAPRADGVVMQCVRVDASSAGGAAGQQPRREVLGEAFLQNRRLRLAASADPRGMPGMLVLLGFLALYERAHRTNQRLAQSAIAFAFDTGEGSDGGNGGGGGGNGGGG